MINIDGRYGEGGGQILRTSLSLSMITGQAFEMSHIRAKRKKSGLMRQHLTAVKAAAAICNSEVKGADLNSKGLRFVPGEITGGEYTFDIGSAGSTMLVLQTILPALLKAAKPSIVHIKGGTHNMMSPPYEMIERSFLPQLHQLGAEVEIELLQHGFYPAGGGEVKLKVKPLAKLPELKLHKRGKLLRQTIHGMISNISSDIAKSEIEKVKERYPDCKFDCEIHDVDSPGPGNVLMIESEYKSITEICTAFGQIGMNRKKVARNVAKLFEAYINTEAPVGIHLADQLLIYLAMAGKGEFVTMRPSSHTFTNINTIKLFTGLEITYTKINEQQYLIAL